MSLPESAPWLVWIIVIPLAAAVLSFLLPRLGAWFGAGSALAILLSSVGLAAQVLANGPVRHPVGGWGASLGIDLYADGLSVLMLLMTAGVGLATSAYAIGYFRTATSAHPQASAFFWPLWMALWAGLNALYLSADLFNAYVTLELIGLASVALVALAGSVVALSAAMRYLLVSLLGSLGYLLGVALLYAAFATLDVATLAQRLTAQPAVWAATALISAGLLLKTALFPLHFWLPPAHASAPAPVSALLSGLVVKASFYLLLRLWFALFAASGSAPDIAQLLGWLGTGAVLWGSVQALRSERLKLLVAYSTVAQLGYLALLFPLSQGPGTGFSAFAGGVYLALSHAFAKAALFLTAGIALQTAGHDRIRELGGALRQRPVAMFALALAAVSLMGLPPSGGFIAKWLLLNASLVSGQWGWGVVIIGGGLLAAIYLFRLLAQLFRREVNDSPLSDVPRSMEWSAFLLALAAIALGLTASYPLALLEVGAPVSGTALRELREMSP